MSPARNVILPNNWRPRHDQMALWSYLEHGGKRAVEVAHRRWGKDDVALHYTACALHERVGVFWHMLPEALQARKAIWTAVNPATGKRRIDEAFPLELRANTNDHEMFLRFKNGSVWQVVGSDNFNSLVGSPPIGLVNSEYALANPSAWGYLSPILEQNGGWAIFIYTPRGRNHGQKLYNAVKRNKDWFCEKVTAEQSPVFSAEQLVRIKQDLIAQFGDDHGAALFNQEYLCSFDAANVGAVYAGWIEKAELEGRIKPLPFDPELPVHTSWDMGYGDATAVWFFQVIRNEIRIIDYWEASGKDIKACCEILYGKEIINDELDKETGSVLKWHFGNEKDGHEHRQKYKYGNHWMPHDAGYKLQAAGGRSCVQQAYEHGVKAMVVEATGVVNGIQAARKMLPLCWINSLRCDLGLDAIRAYHYDFDDKLRRMKDEPKHDWSSHAAKALELMARVWQTPAEALPPPQPKWDIRADEQGRMRAGFTITDYLRDQENARRLD